jgi:hypothetical protein
VGEISEAMLSGLFCSRCGEYMDGEEPGYSRLCGGCEDEPTLEETESLEDHKRARKRRKQRRKRQRRRARNKAKSLAREGQ